MKIFTTTWSRCLAASLAINGVAIGALGTGHLAALASPTARVAKASPKPPTRLMEIRMEKATSPKESSAREDGGKEGDPSSDETAAEGAAKKIPPRSKSARAKAPAPREERGKVPNVDFGHRTLTPPKARVVRGTTGIIDLRKAHIKGTTTADSRLLAKNQPPNKTIGKSRIKVVGKATSLASCVGAVGGNTVYGSKLTILLGKGIDIKGTKYCVPGSGVPGVPGSGTSSSNSSSSRTQSGAATSTGHASGVQTGSASGRYGDKGGMGTGSAATEGVRPGSASGPVRPLDDERGRWTRTDQGGDGGETELHLPASHDDPTDRVRLAGSRSPGAKGREAGPEPVVKARFEAAPISVGSHSEQGTVPWGPDTPKRPRAHGLKGEYYTGTDFETYQFKRIDRNVDFTWTGTIVDPRMPVRHPYSVRWTGTVKADFTETYTFYATSDDGIRVWIDGRLVIDNWTVHAPQEDVVRVPFQAGREVPIRVDYFEINGLERQVVKLYWESPSQPKVYVPSRCLFPPKS